MTEQDASNALFLLGCKFPEWAMVMPAQGVRDLMTDKGRAYIKKHLPDWEPKGGWEKSDG